MDNRAALLLGCTHWRTCGDERVNSNRGQITAVIACRTDTGTVFVLKGNRPLELRWHSRRKAVLYASDPAHLDAVLAEEEKG